METLDIKGMMQDSRYSSGIYEAGWYKLKRMILYKADWKGKTVIEIPQYFPSSQLCNQCNYQHKSLKPTDRKWQCPQCGAIHNRDLNAAINI